MSLAVTRKLLSTKNGFTLIELVIVMIVLGVLAVTALPKLISKSSFEDYAVRDQLIARLRLVQLQGMNADPADNADNACYWLVVKESCFYHEQTVREGGYCKAPAAANVCANNSYNQYNRVSFSEGLLTPAKYRFAIKYGKLTADSDSSPILIAGDNNLQVLINSEGFIYAP